MYCVVERENMVFLRTKYHFRFYHIIKSSVLISFHLFFYNGFYLQSMAALFCACFARVLQVPEDYLQHKGEIGTA